MGVTAEFADVVASINPIAEDQADAPARWTVTFAVAMNVRALASFERQLIFNEIGVMLGAVLLMIWRYRLSRLPIGVTCDYAGLIMAILS